MAGPADERDRLTHRLCQVLIDAREAAGMNQTELAKAVGRTQSFVSNYERGQRRLSVPEFILVARALGVEATELLAKVS